MEFSRELLQLPIRFDADRIAAEVASLPQSAWMPHPTGFPGNDAVPLVSVGGGQNDEFIGPMAATEHLQRMPYVLALMKDLGGVWGRSRLMGLGPGAVVPRHVDIHYYWRTHIRIHVPVTTNPGVRFRCGGMDVHMRPGEAWVFDSFRLHEVRNEGAEKRVHLVLDTVGSDRIGQLIDGANRGAPIPDRPWQPAASHEPAALRFERLNQPLVMSPWEIQCHADYLLEHVVTQPGPQVVEAIDRFILLWRTLWAEHGEEESGWPLYRELVSAARQHFVELGTKQLLLDNEAPLYMALDAMIFSRALMPARPAGQTVSSQNPKAA